MAELKLLPFMQRIQFILADPSYNFHLTDTCVLSCCSRVWLFAILWTVAHQVPLSVGFSQAKVLEWVAVPSSRGSSWPRDWTHISYVSCIGRWVLYPSATWEALASLVSCKPLSSRIHFKTHTTVWLKHLGEKHEFCSCPSGCCCRSTLPLELGSFLLCPSPCSACRCSLPCAASL